MRTAMIEGALAGRDVAQLRAQRAMHTSVRAWLVRKLQLVTLRNGQVFYKYFAVF
jgi:hypothetical protein